MNHVQFVLHLAWITACFPRMVYTGDSYIVCPPSESPGFKASVRARSSAACYSLATEVHTLPRAFAHVASPALCNINPPLFCCAICADGTHVNAAAHKTRSMTCDAAPTTCKSIPLPTPHSDGFVFLVQDLVSASVDRPTPECDHLRSLLEQALLFPCVRDGVCCRR